MKDRINYYIFLPAILVLFFLQTTFLAQAFWNFPLPNLVLLFFLPAIFLASSADFLYIAFALGFLSDLVSGANFGVFTLSFTLFAVAAYWLKMKFIKEESIFRIASASALSAIAYNAIYLAISSFMFNADLSAYHDFIWERTVLDALGAAIATYPAMRLISNGQ